MSPVGVEISLQDPKIDADWRHVFDSLGEAAIQTIAALGTGGATLGGLLLSGWDALKGVKVSETIESKAFALAALALAKATDRVLAQNGDVAEERVFSARRLFSDLKSKSAGGCYVMTRRDLDYPSGFSFYKDIREDLASAISNLLPNQTMDVSLVSSKLDIAFNAAFYELLKQRRDYFLPVVTALNGPGVVAAEIDEDWIRYRNHLIERFEVSPVFGQKEHSVALSQLYVPLGGRWEVVGSNVEYRHVDDLGALFQEWIRSGPAHDDVRLLFGGPGSGKSTIAKALASTLAKSEAVRPVLIELQHTNGFGDLRHAVEQRLVQEGEWFRSDPLSQKDENRPFFLIFDGLDELVVPGSTAASRVADGFVVALKALMRNLNGQSGTRARAVVTGRSAIMQSFGKSYDVKPGAAIEVTGFLYSYDGGEGRIYVDKRPDWWGNFSLAYSKPAELPAAFSDRRLDDITSEPLLCFLMAISGYMAENWAEAAENTNRIYSKLIGEVWQRKWGQGEHTTSGRVGPSLKLKSEEDFNLLMEALALAAWWGGENRIATKSMFEQSLDVTKAHEVWKSFREDDGDEMQNLALMFYMRRSEVEGQGIEFTHKTFSEYLVARFMMRFAWFKVSRSLENRDIDLLEASRRWCAFATKSRSYRALNGFLRNEAKLLSTEELRIMHKSFVDFVSHALSVGLPIHNVSSRNFRELTVEEATGKYNAISVLSAVTYALRERGEVVVNSINWNDDRTAPARLIGSLVDFRGAQYATDLDMPNFDFSCDGGAFATCLFAADADLSGANFSHAVLYQAFFSDANLSSADFSEATMDHGNYRDANLHRANLSSADLENSVLTGCDLSGANLTNANLTRCWIDDALMDYGWWDAVEPRTFLNPPIGAPALLINDKVIEEKNSEYPDLFSIYEEKKSLARERQRSELPF